MRHRGITAPDDADRYIRDVFLPAYDSRFAVKADDDGTAFVPRTGGDPAEILCVTEERQVGKDNCVRYDGRSLRIPPQAHRHRFVKTTVTGKEYPDGAMAVFHGPRCPARYDADGAPAPAQAVAA